MDTAIHAADERMVYVTGDREAIRAYEMRQMALSDYTSSMNYARDKGREEGLEQVARKMKNAGRPIKEIALFTGLDTETIQGLLHN